MSSIQDRKCYLQLWTFTTGPAIDVMQLYFEVKILNNTNFENFLNDQNNMHQLFHQCFPTTPGCKCSAISLASANKRGCLILKQFDKLYDNFCLPQPRHEIFNGTKITHHCLCKYSTKCSVAVDDLDITLFYDIIQHCCPSKMNFTWRKRIKDTLDVFNGLKPLQTEVEECKKRVECIHNNQNDHLYKLQSSLDKSDEILNETKEKKVELRKMTSDFKEVKHTVDNLKSLIKVDRLESIISIALEKAIEKGKGKESDYVNRKITVATQVDSSCWNEEKTIRNISIVNTEIDRRSVDTENVHIKCVENKCIQLELVAFPDVYKTPQTLRKTVKSLVHQLVEAGEIDTQIPGKLEIGLTVKTPLTKEEIAVVYAVFNKLETLEESAGKIIDAKPDLNDGILLIQTLKIDP
ncbi:unnamed protein product [Mytilus coruscus]|uniref:DZIP3-like HEPN domain-containing protein n=1 Tax=Mytilus coruscus TaxID=42192 RepID=A0A6J8EPS3_MYTCO|nr:unnamed protein product [Mytilus coruscus]